MENFLDRLPPDVRSWAENLPWEERRCILSLCHLLCASPQHVQSEFLDDYTADGLIAKILQDQDIQTQLSRYLRHFHIPTILSQQVLRDYIRQYYVHLAQAKQAELDQYLASALRLVVHPEEQQQIIAYVLGFELLKVFFRMSWSQHERLYKCQINQDHFFHDYIKPIQKAHRLNGIIKPNPRDEKSFFSKRDYFVQLPKISEKKLIQLLMVTFSHEKIAFLGFNVNRNLNSLVFDYDYIFSKESEETNSTSQNA